MKYEERLHSYNWVAHFGLVLIWVGYLSYMAEQGLRLLFGIPRLTEQELFRFFAVVVLTMLLGLCLVVSTRLKRIEEAHEDKK